MPCSNTNSHPAWDKLNNTGPPGPQGPPGEQGESGLKGNQGPNGAPIPGLNPLGDYNVQITNEVSLSDNTALGKISVPEAGVTVSYLIDVLKEMGIVSRDPKKWGQLGTQDLLVGAVGDSAGRSVSLSADGLTVAVGAPYHNASRGHVRVFSYNIVRGWTQIGGDLVGAVGDRAGSSVSLSADGMTVAVGAPFHDGELLANNYKGRVRVFRYDGDSDKWGQLGTQDLFVGAAGDRAGSSVSLSEDGMTVAVGEPFANESLSGRVRVFRYDGDKWGQLGSDLEGAVAGDQAGYSVSLSADGKTVAVGATAAYSSAKLGQVRVFIYDDTQWVGGEIVGVAGDSVGFSVSLSADGLTVAVGAPDGEGRVRVFRYDDTQWVQVGGEIVGVAENAGYSVSLSADGKTVAVGAPYFPDYNNKGRVRVFRYDDTQWVHVGGEIVGVAENAGWSVSLSADGLTVAVGAPFHDDYNKGRVQVFKL